MCPGCQSPGWDDPQYADNDYQSIPESADLTGRQFGLLMVISKVGNRNGKSLWSCKCKCGEDRLVIGRLLRKGFVRSCGCDKKRVSFWPKFEHGATFNHYKGRARQRKLAFELSREQFLGLLLSPCHYCGSTLDVGVDRKDTFVGYTVSNSVPACRICNYGKNKITESEFVAYINHIRQLGPPDDVNKVSNDAPLK